MFENFPFRPPPNTSVALRLRKSNSRREPGHDYDSGHSHNALKRNSHEIAVGQARNPGRVGVVPLQLQTHALIRGQQASEPLHGHQNNKRTRRCSAIRTAPQSVLRWSGASSTVYCSFP